jgi:Zn-dependent alcohol dehydrogenase
MKVRGAVLSELGCPKPYEQSTPLKIENLELAPPGADELLVRVLAAGLCHSDLSVIDGSRARPMPMVLGHEGCGEIVEIGPRADNADNTDAANALVVGDRVVFSFVPSCGRCQFCLIGRDALCEAGAKANAAGELLSGGCRWHDARHKTVYHHLGVSAFAEMTVISACSVVRIDKDLSPEIAALFGCAVLTGVGAVMNTAAVEAGSSVAIFGLGGVGLAALLGAKAAGALTIVAVDILPEKLAKAKQMGATHTIMAGTDLDVVTALKDITAGGAQYTFETAGNESALVQAYQATKRGGTTVAVGLPHLQKMFSIPAVSLVAEERVVKGSYMGSAVPSRDIPRYISMYREGALPVDKLLTHRLSLDQINAGFDRLARGEALRQMVMFGRPDTVQK